MKRIADVLRYTSMRTVAEGGFGFFFYVASDFLGIRGSFGFEAGIERGVESGGCRHTLITREIRISSCIPAGGIRRYIPYINV